MNIEQYRALKAQEEVAKAQPQVEQPIVNPAVEVPVEDGKKVDAIEIDGKEVTIDELKNGYLRQSDYTKKTQQLANQKKESEEAIRFYEHLKNNPEIVQQLQVNTNVPRTLDPTQAKVIELEEKMYDMMLEREVETLQSKYSDFEIKEVLEMASQKQLTNLEDAYLLVKSSKSTPQQSIDVNKLKEELRQELMKEINSNVDTSSIISSGGGQAIQVPNTPTLSEGELKVARMMGLTPEDYTKWRDIDKNIKK